MFRSERLIEQRENSGYTKVQLCTLSQIPPKKYEKFEAGSLSPNCRELVRIAKTLKTTADYLLGMDLPLESEISMEDLPSDSFAIRFARLLSEWDESVEDIAPIVDRAVSTVYGWRNGRVIPDMKSIIILSNHFNCSSDYLIGISTQRNILSVS